MDDERLRELANKVVGNWVAEPTREDLYEFAHAMACRYLDKEQAQAQARKVMTLDDFNQQILVPAARELRLRNVAKARAIMAKMTDAEFLEFMDEWREPVKADDAR